MLYGKCRGGLLYYICKKVLYVSNCAKGEEREKKKKSDQVIIVKNDDLLNGLVGLAKSYLVPSIQLCH